VNRPVSTGGFTSTEANAWSHQSHPHHPRGGSGAAPRSRGAADL